jgi:hypothetical protein
MEALLKVRLDLKLNNSQTDSFAKFYLNHDDAIVAISGEAELARQATVLGDKKTKDFSINSYMVNASEFFSMDIPVDLKIPIIDQSTNILIIEIELGVSQRDNLVPNSSISFTPNYTFALTVARHKVKDTVKDFEVVIVKDNYTRTRTVFTSPKPTTIPIGAKYRLFLDNIMISERFYPYDIIPDDILEENIIVDILPGKHEVRIENVRNHTVIITDLKFDQQIIRDVNAGSCSFEFN